MYPNIHTLTWQLRIFTHLRIENKFISQYVYVRMCTCADACICVHECVLICMCVFVWASVCVCVCVCSCVCAHVCGSCHFVCRTHFLRAHVSLCSEFFFWFLLGAGSGTGQAYC